jgi:hypothetical protein
MESPPGEGMRTPRYDKDPSLKNLSKPDNSYLEDEMEDTRKSTLDLEAIAWGAFFILWGITELIPSLPEGIGALGIGMILLGLNLARSWKGEPTSGFTTTLGTLALLLGGLELVEPYLHLPFELPIFAILLLALGSIILIRAMKK